MNELKDQRPAEPVALYDLDGTLADFDGAMRAWMERLAPPGEKAYWEEQDGEPAHIRERRRLVKRQPGFWSSLPQFRLGFDVLSATRELGYQHMVLSKGPRSNEAAWAEKIVWCRQNMPPGLDYKITLGEDKGLVYGKVLVDDWISYVERWLTWRPRGLVIMPAHERNKGFRHPCVVRYDGTNMAEVVERLRAQRATAAE
jgi:hypothetical protein